MPNNFDLERLKGLTQQTLQGLQKRDQDAAKFGYDQSLQKDAQAASLEQLLGGKALDHVNKKDMLDTQVQQAEAWRKKYGNQIPVNVEGVSLGGIDPLAALIKARELSKPSLTPTQIEAEKSAGKEIANYKVKGGKPAMEKNIKALTAVEAELGPDAKEGGRDWWDRNVGGLLSTSPALMGRFAPAEKGRRDRARNTALSIAKQNDPNPSEKQQEAIFGQVYDPASSNEENLKRIQGFAEEHRAKAAQLEAAEKRYDETGYATLGTGGSTQLTPRQKRIQEIKARLGK